MELKELEGKIINADCMDILKQLPDKSIDLVLTDPPYGIGADKGTNGYGNSKNRKYVSNWDKETPQKEIFEEILRVSKNQIIFGGNYFADKLPLSKCWIVWDKVGENKFNNPFADVELAWTSYRKVCKKYTCIQQGFINEDKDSARIHPTQKPVKLFEKIIADYSNENALVIDPFSGSGTTAIACHRLKRRFICIERDKEYWSKSCERLKAEQAQLLLF